jgi:hypothetical protein
MPGGLGAILQQPGGAPKGASSRNMQQVVDIARKMSDMQLADVLAGKSLDVPQYVAMTEAMGRKSLRTAVQGAQAQQQKQPSVKDRLMAEEAAAQMPQGMPMVSQQPVMAAGGGAIDMNESSGIAGLSAPNMDSMDMASGGIVAFQNKGLVEDEQTLRDREGAKEALEKMIAAGKDVFSLPGRALGGAYNTTNRGVRSLGFNTPYIPESYFGGDSASMTPYMDILEKQKAGDGKKVPAAALPPVDTGSKPDSLGRHIANADAPAAAAAASSKGGGKSPGITALAPDSYEDLQKKKSSDYLTKLEGLSEKQRAGIAQIKKEGSGEALMQLGSALMGSRNLAEAGARAGQQIASTSAGIRKEVRGVENLANEYDLNLAKAQEAAEKGDMALALQFKQLADQAKYQQGMLAVHGQRNALMGQGGNLAKVSTALLNIDKQALNEAKEKFPMVTKSNQAAFDSFIKKRSMELKMANPLTKEYANLSAGDLGGGSRFNTVQSLPKGASLLDLDA